VPEVNDSEHIDACRGQKNRATRRVYAQEEARGISHANRAPFDKLIKAAVRSPHAKGA